MRNHCFGPLGAGTPHKARVREIYSAMDILILGPCMVWLSGMLGGRVYGLVVLVGHFDSETINGLVDRHDRGGLVVGVMVSPFFHACIHMRPYMVTCWADMYTKGQLLHPEGPQNKFEKGV